MGPRLVNRGNDIVTKALGASLEASMGPRLVNRGNTNSQESHEKVVELQWGRD